jgi:hypothetical protein
LRRGGEAFQSAHRPQPSLQPAVIRLDPVVAVSLGDVPRCRQQFVQHAKVGRRLVGGDLERPRDLLQRPGEEPASRRRIPLLAGQHVDDLPELVDRPVQVAPPTADLEIRLIHPPPVADRVPAGTRGVSEQRGEPLHPPVHGDVVDLDAALGQQLLRIPVRQV